jgi:hypothetical protein
MFRSVAVEGRASPGGFIRAGARAAVALQVLLLAGSLENLRDGKLVAFDNMDAVRARGLLCAPQPHAQATDA